MIAEYNESGIFVHVRSPPVPAGLVERLNDEGISFVDLTGLDLSPTEIMQNYYVDEEGELTLRPEIDAPDEISIIANGVDEFVIDVPDPCHIRLDGEPQVIEGGHLVLQSDMPATYEIMFVQMPYKLKTIRVVANVAP